MKKARKFVQPMKHTGLPNTGNWDGYEYLQWTGSCIHPGIDYNWGAGEQDKGKPIFAIGNGLVTKCIKWNGYTKGFGNHIFIKHILDFDYQLGEVKLKRGNVIYSHYCHLDTIDVKEGQEVNVGDKIGTCGGSGGWSSHLHIELRLPIGKGYNFWPKGYSYDWISKYYLDVYQFIEDNKNMSDIHKGLDLNNKESMKIAVNIWYEVIKEGKWIKKDNYNKKIKELKDNQQEVVNEALKKAKKDWKVSEVKEKIKEIEKIRKTTVYQIAVALTEILKNIEKKER